MSQDLRVYFHADGNGLSEEFLQEKTKEINHMLDLYEKPTRWAVQFTNSHPNRELVEYFVKLSSDPKVDPDIKPIHLKKILEGRTTDKLAQTFLEEHRNPKERERQSQVQKR